MADNLGPMAWLFLPENELPQWQQKIALRAENKSGPNGFYAHLRNFQQVLDLLIFRQQRQGY